MVQRFTVGVLADGASKEAKNPAVMARYQDATHTQKELRWRRTEK